MRALPPLLLTLAVLSPAACARPPVVAGEQAACTLATERVTALRGLPTRHVARCETLADDGDHYALVLYAHCTTDEVCGSTRMGEFAVRKSDGEVREWDVSEERVGPPLAKPR